MFTAMQPTVHYPGMGASFQVKGLKHLKKVTALQTSHVHFITLATSADQLEFLDLSENQIASFDPSEWSVVVPGRRFIAHSQLNHP